MDDIRYMFTSKKNDEYVYFFIIDKKKNVYEFFDVFIRSNKEIAKLLTNY